MTNHKQRSKSEVTQSCPTLCNPWTVAYQAPPPSMGFSRQEYWSGLPFPSPGDLPDSGTEPRSPALQADAFTSEPPGKPKQRSDWRKIKNFMFAFPLNSPSPSSQAILHYEMVNINELVNDLFAFHLSKILSEYSYNHITSYS